MGNRNKTNLSNQTIAMCKLSPFFLLLLLLLSGCAANKSNIDYLQKTSSCPVQFSFNGSYKQVWQATLRALAEEEIIKTMNQDAGIAVTEYGTVDNLELNAIDTAFGARTYKYSYSINLMKAAPVRTNVSVNINLMTSQLALYEREQNIPWLESYLRKKLFIRICKQLNPAETQQCNSLTKKNNPGPHQPVLSSQPEQKPDTLVLQVQTTLNKRGYNPGQADGFMGDKTREAIRQFQQDINIAATGRTDQNTLIALGLKEGTVVYNDQEPEQKSTPPDHRDTKTKTIKLASTTNLLQAKDPYSKSITTLPEGSVLTIKSIEGEWYQVQYQDQIGFVHWAFVIGQRKSTPVKTSANNTAAQDVKNTDSGNTKKTVAEKAEGEKILR